MKPRRSTPYRALAASAVLLALLLPGWSRAQFSIPVPEAGSVPNPSEGAPFSGTAGDYVRLRGDELFAGKSGSARRVASGPGWKEVARDGSDAWLLQGWDGAASLVRCNLASGRTETVLTGLQSAGGLFSAAGRVFWLEQAGAGSPFTFIPELGPRLRLRCRESSGRVHDLGAFPVEDAGGPGPGDVVGVDGEGVVARVRLRGATEWVRFSLDGRGATRLAAERGTQDSALTPEGLFWTAPSRESADETTYASVRGPAGRERLLVDWLPARGRLLSAGGGLYYHVGSTLYRIRTDGLAAPERVAGEISGPLVSDGRSLLRFGGAGGVVAVEVR